ncbi:hypothetical protein HPB51_006663 [Rhipicephalus microplus]|uniref:Anoctamin dimerisation domain-containing protein n=1 Tax=Rhipicephalus microplus TaxID=6941 RepID=A0A9J6E6X8_RHIMP|nr:hypothetical protein HPB51_006663 [Rhipicephalus microplus]
MMAVFPERAASAYERALDEESVLVALGDMKASPNGDGTAPLNPSGLCFVKIHAPWEVLSCFAEIMRLKMPVKEWSLRMQEQNAMLDCEPVEIRSMGRRQKQFAVTFSMSKEYLFDIPEPKEDFFSAAQRAQVVHFILQRKSFSRDTQRRHFGIGRLLADGVYLAAYPVARRWL